MKHHRETSSTRNRSRVLLAVTGLLLAGDSARAQSTVFFPELALEQGYSSNVLYLGESGAASDLFARLTVLLPVERQMRTGSWRLSYQGAATKYREFGVLDHISQSLGFNAQHQPARRSSLAFNASYAQTQDQGDPDPDDPNRFLSGRQDQETLRARLFYGRDTGARWRLDAALDGSWNRFEPISGGDPGALASEDWRGLAATLGFSRRVSRRTTFGLRFSHQFYDREVTGREDSQLLGVTFNYSPGGDLALGGELGAYRRHRDPLLAGVADLDDHGLQGRISLGYSFGRQALAFAASHAPSSGGNLPGTSTNTTAGISLSGTPGPRWRWRLNSTYTRRDSTIVLASTLVTISNGVSIERLPRRKLGFRLSGEYVDQSGSASGRLNGAFGNTRVGLVWYPRGLPR